MVSNDNKARKREAMGSVHVVEEILRRWDPIGVEPGEMAPLDEYDSYAPHIVSLVVAQCSPEELSAHLHTIRTEVMEEEACQDRDAEIADEIIAALREQAV